MPIKPILIVGAGPTGLNLALRLAHAKVAFRIIDQHDGPAQESRALAVHARTLELYGQLGLAEAIVAEGVKINGIRIHEAGRERAHIPLGDIGAGLSPYPFILDFPQDEHERFLVDRLREMGVEVERKTSLVSFQQSEDAVEAIVEREGEQEHVRALYLCGCDGARSAVRNGLDLGFAGGSYEHLYYVADVELKFPDREHDFHIAMGPDTFALRLPARRGAMERLIGFVADGVDDPTFDDVKASAERLLQIKVAKLNWFSTYRVHHRVADHFRIGRAFLLGDAGHLHSPVGGQGMNTGIGDAVNLGWKLAAVVKDQAAPAILDTYEPERIAFARELVATTDRMFRMVVSEGLSGRIFRTLVMPTFVPAATAFEGGRHTLFRLASQIAIKYPQSALSEGAAGTVVGGDRLPWIKSADNYAQDNGRCWQLHVYGEPAEDLRRVADDLDIALLIFPWNDETHQAGLANGAAYLVRPDGYVGLAARRDTACKLQDYVAKHALAFHP